MPSSQLALNGTTGMMGGAAVGGAAAGGIAYMMCKKGCPGASGSTFNELGSLVGLGGGGGPKWKDDMEPNEMRKYTARKLCLCNCKAQAMMVGAAGAGAGAAVGKFAGNKAAAGGMGMPGVPSMPKPGLPMGLADPLDEWTMGPVFGLWNKLEGVERQQCHNTGGVSGAVGAERQVPELRNYSEFLLLDSGVPLSASLMHLAPAGRPARARRRGAKEGDDAIDVASERNKKRLVPWLGGG